MWYYWTTAVKLFRRNSIIPSYFHYWVQHWKDFLPCICSLARDISENLLTACLHGMKNYAWLDCISLSSVVSLVWGYRYYSIIKCFPCIIHQYSVLEYPSWCYAKCDFTTITGLHFERNENEFFRKTQIWRCKILYYHITQARTTSTIFHARFNYELTALYSVLCSH